MYRNCYNDGLWNLNWLRRYMRLWDERWKVNMWIGDLDELKNFWNVNIIVGMFGG